MFFDSLYTFQLKPSYTGTDTEKITIPHCTLIEYAFGLLNTLNC